MMQTLKRLARDLKTQFQVYRLIRHHPRTPWTAKCLLALAIAYILMPFDLIPDFLPVIGQLDDLVIVPGLVYLALKLVPADVVQECRDQQQAQALHSTAMQQENRETQR